MKKIIINLFILVVLSLDANEDSANKNIETKKGLFLAIGAGLGQEQLNYLIDSKLDRTDSYLSLATSFKVGIFLSDNLGIFYSNYTNFLSAPYMNNNINSNSIYMDAINGGGIIYYLDRFPHFYLSVGGGMNTFMTIGQRNAESGSAYMASVGYEFENHINVELVLMKFANLQSSDYSYL